MTAEDVLAQTPFTHRSSFEGSPHPCPVCGGPGTVEEYDSVTDACRKRVYRCKNRKSGQRGNPKYKRYCDPTVEKIQEDSMPKPTPEWIASIKEQMKAKGLTVADVAKYALISPITVKNVLHGGAPTGPDTKQKIEDAMVYCVRVTPKWPPGTSPDDIAAGNFTPEGLHQQYLSDDGGQTVVAGVLEKPQPDERKPKIGGPHGTLGEFMIGKAQLELDGVPIPTTPMERYVTRCLSDLKSRLDAVKIELIQTNFATIDKALGILRDDLATVFKRTEDGVIHLNQNPKESSNKPQTMAPWDYARAIEELSQGFVRDHGEAAKRYLDFISEAWCEIEYPPVAKKKAS